MQAFLHKDFLLQGHAARVLYHDYAAGMPIIDYHCHLLAEDIATDRRFANMTRAWLEGDHYKWRAMRMNGVEEKYCTGEAPDREKFGAWAKTVPFTLMNPLYHWTHLELRRYFGIAALLSEKTAREIYDHCTAMLQEPTHGCRGLLRQMNVKVVCTTNDPIESLGPHEAIAAAPFGTVVVPGFRADAASAIGDPCKWRKYMALLGEAAGFEINSPDALLEALQRRHDYFAARGCVVSDHGEETLHNEPYTKSELRRIFSATMHGTTPTAHDVGVFKSWLLHELAVMDHAKGWTQQFHLAALRNNNSRAPAADSGFDSIGDFAIALPVARFLDRLNVKGKLARTILYSANPAHNEVLSSMCGNFCEGPVPGKIQFGTAWWFMDQIDGMERQIKALANMGLLSRFVGMLTDSRSLLSFPRHEYFRRILCNLVGAQVEGGELPNDLAWLGGIIQDICYNNAHNYFGFAEPNESQESEVELSV